MHISPEKVTHLQPSFSLPAQLLPHFVACIIDNITTWTAWLLDTSDLHSSLQGDRGTALLFVAKWAGHMVHVRDRALWSALWLHYLYSGKYHLPIPGTNPP